LPAHMAARVAISFLYTCTVCPQLPVLGGILPASWEQEGLQFFLHTATDGAPVPTSIGAFCLPPRQPRCHRRLYHQCFACLLGGQRNCQLHTHHHRGCPRFYHHQGCFACLLAARGVTSFLSAFPGDIPTFIIAGDPVFVVWVAKGAGSFLHISAGTFPAFSSRDSIRMASIRAATGTLPRLWTFSGAA
jgi:hypothetical protein